MKCLENDWVIETFGKGNRDWTADERWLMITRGAYRADDLITPAKFDPKYVTNGKKKVTESQYNK